MIWVACKNGKRTKSRIFTNCQSSMLSDHLFSFVKWLGFIPSISHAFEVSEITIFLSLRKRCIISWVEFQRIKKSSINIVIFPKFESSRISFKTWFWMIFDEREILVIERILYRTHLTDSKTFSCSSTDEFKLISLYSSSSLEEKASSTS